MAGANAANVPLWLLEALRSAKAGNVTDEASAVEQLGLKPRLVMGSASNIKVTWPDDVAFATNFLAARHG
jgi:2-C-methyl-D-erythritol 4-phosphate cytidylyltransferase